MRCAARTPRKKVTMATEPSARCALATLAAAARGRRRDGSGAAEEGWGPTAYTKVRLWLTDPTVAKVAVLACVAAGLARVNVG